MDFSGFMDSIVSFAQNNTIIVIVIALGLFFLMVRKPKLFLGILLLGLFLAGLFYMITSMGSSGTDQKKRLMHEEGRQSDDNR